MLGGFQTASGLIIKEVVGLYRQAELPGQYQNQNALSEVYYRHDTVEPK